MKKGLKETGYQSVDRIHFTQD